MPAVMGLRPSGPTPVGDGRVDTLQGSPQVPEAQEVLWSAQLTLKRLQIPETKPWKVWTQGPKAPTGGTSKKWVKGDMKE